MLYTITKHKICIEPFVQYKGIETIILILEYSNDIPIISDCIEILMNVIDANDEYKLILIDKNIEELIKEKSVTNTEIEERAKSILTIY